ncbi:unnamed protein product [Hapterophycus canaliculatus]
MDIGLVGASVFVLACLMQPTETTWVAKLQRDDGTIASFRVDHPVNDENELRQAVLDDLVQSKPGKQGMVRWQNESAQFYAQADSDRLASTSRPSPFQTASFDAEKNIAAEDDSKSERWVGFWQRRSEQSATWLSQHQDAQQQRLARISQSLEIARLNSLLPARDGMLVAMAAASLGPIR